MRTKRVWFAIVAMVGVGLGAVALVTSLLRDGTAPRTEVLEMPVPGEARPDYLADGTPVWVIGHEDGQASVLSGFDTHRPFNLGKILWWCPSAMALENPEHGSTYDEYGRRIGGPAPTGLPSYAMQVVGGRLRVGALNDPPPSDARHSGPPEHERDRCVLPEDEGDLVYHTFDGWRTWDSPTAAVEAAPDGWILLDGSLQLRAGQAVLCAPSGCDDAVPAANVEGPIDPTMEFGPLGGERFIARVRDGALTDVTRVMPAPNP